jgi:flagellar assembly protein FliH
VKNLSKVIGGDQAQEFRSWSIPELQSKSPDRGQVQVQEPTQNSAGQGLLTAEKIAEIQAQAYQEGFSQGRKEGFEAGNSEVSARAQQLNTLMGLLNEPFKQLDAQVEQELLVLVITLTRQLVRREMRHEPGEILAVIRQTMSALPTAARDVRLHLHPEDSALVRESLALNETEPSWRIVEDPVLTRGDCRVVSETSQIDATLENRLNALITSMLGGERARDRQEP